jgi:hypothetical protein
MAKELLNDSTIRNAKPADKDRRFNDGSGLYLLINTQRCEVVEIRLLHRRQA